MSQREEKFEQMLRSVQQQYQETSDKMEQLKAAGKEKSATFRQLMGNKLTLQNMLTLYQVYGLLEK